MVERAGATRLDGSEAIISRSLLRSAPRCPDTGDHSHIWDFSSSVPEACLRSFLCGMGVSSGRSACSTRIQNGTLKRTEKKGGRRRRLSLALESVARLSRVEGELPLMRPTGACPAEPHTHPLSTHALQPTEPPRALRVPQALNSTNAS